MSALAQKTHDFFTALADQFALRRAAAAKCGSCTFAILGGGPRYTLDAASPTILRDGFDDDADVIVLLNRATLDDMCAGAFDVSAPRPENVFLVAGDEQRVAALNQVLKQHNLLSLRSAGATP